MRKNSEKERLNSGPSSSSNNYGSNDNKYGNSTFNEAYPILPPVSMPQHYAPSTSASINNSQPRITEVGVEMQQYGNNVVSTNHNVNDIVLLDENGKHFDLGNKNGNPITTYVEEIDSTKTVPNVNYSRNENRPKMVYLRNNREFQVLEYPHVPDVSIPSGEEVRKDREDDKKFYQDKSYSYHSTLYKSVYDKSSQEDKVKEDDPRTRVIIKKTESGDIEKTVIPEESEGEVIKYFHFKDTETKESEEREDGYKIPEYTPLY